MRPPYHKFVLILSFWLLSSCSNTEIGNLSQPRSTIQAPLIQAENILPSPDASWTAYIYGYDFENFMLSVENFDDTVIWNVRQTNGGDHAWFTPYRWSKDSRYLYFNIHVTIDGYVPFYQGMGLQRLDVLTGQVSEILSLGEPITLTNNFTTYNWNIVRFSLSPADDKLAYIIKTNDGVQLVIRDMKTNKENSILFDQYIDAGSIIWSPKQNLLALAASRGTNWSNTIGFVELIEVNTLTSRTLAKNKSWVFDPITWVNNHTILVKERGGDYFYLDIITEKLNPASSLMRFPN